MWKEAKDDETLKKGYIMKERNHNIQTSKQKRLREDNSGTTKKNPPKFYLTVLER